MVIGTVQTLNRLLAQGGPADTGSADRRVAFGAPVVRTASLEAELGTPEPAAKAKPERAAAPRPTTRVAARSKPKTRVAREPAVEQPLVQQPVYQAQPVTAQSPYGARYLAPVQNGGYRAPGTQQASPYRPPVVAPPTQSLDSSLPAQAYQGPRAQRPPPGQGTYNY